MSICSTHSSGVAPDRTVSANGYRLTTTSSNGSMPSSASWRAWSGLRRSARIPACTRGCSVLTRPSRHSGNPVRSATCVTGDAERGDRRRGGTGRDDLDAGLGQALRELGQPGLVVHADQRAPNPPAPVASAARRTAGARRTAAHGIVTFLPWTDQPERAIRPTASTSIARSDDLDALVQRRLVVAVEDVDRSLRDDRAGVDPGVDQEQRRAGHLHAVRQRVARAVHARGTTAAAPGGC